MHTIHAARTIVTGWDVTAPLWTFSTSPIGSVSAQPGVEELTAASLVTRLAVSVFVPLAVGVLLLGITPAFTERSVGTARRRTLGSVLKAIGVAIAAVLLTFGSLVVFPPLAVVFVIPVALVLIVGQAMGMIALGVSVLARVHEPNPDRWLGLVTGVGVFIVAAQIPLLGWLANLVVSLAGIGACVAVFSEEGYVASFREYVGFLAKSWTP